jgi:hypothetical protein
VLPTPKKFWTTLNFSRVSTFHTGLPSRARTQCSIPSGPKWYTRSPSTTGQHRAPPL